MKRREPLWKRNTRTFLWLTVVAAASAWSATAIGQSRATGPNFAESDQAATPEDRPIEIAVLQNDRAAAGASQRIVNVTAPAHGRVAVTASQTILYTPAPDYHGVDSFTYAMTVGNAPPSTATVSVTVDPVNDAPTALAASVSTPAQTPVAIVLAGADVDGDALTYTIVQQPQHGVLAGSVGARSYTPIEGFVGADSIAFQASDGHLSSEPAVIQIAITPPPVVRLQAAPMEGPAPLNVTFQADAEAATGHSLTYSWQFGEGSTPVNGGASMTHTFDGVGEHAVKVVVADREARTTAEIVVRATVANAPPVASACCNVLVRRLNTRVTLDGSASTDPDGDSLTYRWTLVSQPFKTFVGGGLGFGFPPVPFESTAQSTTFVFAQFGTYVFELAVFDGSAWSPPSQVRVEWNNGGVPLPNQPPGSLFGWDAGTGSIKIRFPIDPGGQVPGYEGGPGFCAIADEMLGTEFVLDGNGNLDAHWFGERQAALEDAQKWVGIAHAMTCHGMRILPHLDCPIARDLFIMVTGSSPEDLIIDLLPLPEGGIKEFLRSRFNICTGFDLSGLTCREVVDLAADLAPIALPGLGQVLASPVARFIVQSLLCDGLDLDFDVGLGVSIGDVPFCTLALVNPVLALGCAGCDLPDFPLSIPDFDFGGGSFCWFNCKDDASEGGGGGAYHPGDGPFWAPPRDQPSCAVVPADWASMQFGDLRARAAALGVTPLFLLNSIIACRWPTPVPGFPYYRTDLGVQVTTAETPVVGGAASFLVRNAGPATILQVGLRLSVPAALRVVSATTATGSCVATSQDATTQILDCSFGQMATNAERIVTLLVNGPTAAYQVVATITGNFEDTAPADNEVTAAFELVNQAPSAHHATVTVQEGQQIAIVLTGSDPEGGALTFAIQTPSSHGQLTGVAPNVTYRPTSGFTGGDSFTFAVSDGEFQSAPATVTIQVRGRVDLQPVAGLGVIATVDMPQRPQGVAINPRTHTAFVVAASDGNPGKYVVGIDTRTNQIVGRWDVGSRPSYVTVNVETGKVYATTFWFDPYVWEIDPAANTVSRIYLGDGWSVTQGVDVDPVRNRLYVAHDGGGLTIVDIAQRAVIRHLGIGGGMGVRVNPVTNKVYVAEHSGVSIVDGTTFAVKTIPLNDYTGGVAINTVTNRIYVSSQSFGLNKVHMLDGNTDEVIGMVPVAATGGIAVDEERNLVYVSYSWSSFLTVLDGTSLAIRGGLYPGLGPVGVAVDANTGRVYVGAYSSGVVTVVAPPLSLSPVSPKPGDSATVRGLLIANRQNGVSDPVRVRIYLTLDGSRASAIAPLADVLVNGIAGQTQVLVEPEVVIPASLPPGQYFLTVAVDEGNNVVETDETNNTTSVPLTISSGPSGNAAADTSSKGQGG